MRKALFAVVLVAASFAGGAVINGPAISWAKAYLVSALQDKNSPSASEEIEPVPSAPLPFLANPLNEIPKPRSEPPRFDPVIVPASNSPVTPTQTTSVPPAPILPDRLDAPTAAPKREAPVVLVANPRTGDWASLRKKLASQGVARYRVEVDLDGKTHFSCMIPLVGRRAVSQHFEAEGDDEFQAAESVLKRIVLWKASEAEPEPTPEPKP